MNWSEVFVSVLKNLDPKYSIRYETHNKANWSGNDADIFVKYGDGEEMPLWDFVDSLQKSRHEILHDHVMVITRIFDHRVKSFIKNILMGPGKDKLPISYYTYRVEFQGEYRTLIEAGLDNPLACKQKGEISNFWYTAKNIQYQTDSEKTCLEIF